MWDVIISFLAEHYPILIWVLVTIAVTWNVSKVYNRFKKVEETSKNVPCEQHHASIQSIQGNMPILRDIKESVRKIEDYIIKKDPKSLDVLLRKCSPYKITNYGQVLLEISGAKKCIDENANFFILAIEEMKPLVALDVEQYSLNVLTENLKNNMFNEVKNYVYNAPDPVTLKDSTSGEEISTSISIENVLMVMSIYLRDKYFEKHPEIDISTFFITK